MNLAAGTRALVTGATGLVGNNLVRVLIGRGVTVRVLVRSGSDPRPLVGLEVEKVEGDVRDGKVVASAAKGMDFVFHAAARVRIGSRGIVAFREINAGGTRNVVDAVRTTGGRLVHVSTTDTVGHGSAKFPADENSSFDATVRIPYMLTKKEAEDLVLVASSEGLEAIVVNPSFMLGPWDWKPSSGEMLLAVGRGRGLLAPRGCGSFVDVRDVCAGICAAAERGARGQRYILGGETLSYLEAWRLFAEVAGRRPPLRQLGPVLGRMSGLTGDMIGWVTGRELSVNSAAIQVADRPRYYSSAKAEVELGYRRRPLRETVEDAWTWFRDHGYA